MMDRRNLITLPTKKGQNRKLSFMGSDAAEFVNKVKDQKCEVDRKECRTLQIQEKSIL